MKESEPKFLINARVNEFTIPPITDGLIVGTHAPIGVNALKKALNILIPENFELLNINDEVIGDILMKSTIVRRMGQDRIVYFLMNQVKGFMTKEDIFHIKMEVEISITQEIE